MKIKKHPKGIIGYITTWFLMILMVVFMPLLQILFKYSISLEAERK